MGFFSTVVCPEGPCGIDFLEKSSEIGLPKIQEIKKSQDWPDLDPEPIFLDFGTIVMVRKSRNIGFGSEIKDS